MQKIKDVEGDICWYIDFKLDDSEHPIDLVVTNDFIFPKTFEVDHETKRGITAVFESCNLLDISKDRTDVIMSELFRGLFNDKINNSIAKALRAGR